MPHLISLFEMVFKIFSIVIKTWNFADCYCHIFDKWLEVTVYAVLTWSGGRRK